MTMEDLIFKYITLSILAYAEIHFRFPFLPSRLYQKEPEIIFDLPFRARINQSVPLFLFIKDAHIFPVKLIEITIETKDSNGNLISLFSQNSEMEIQEKFLTKKFYLKPDLFPGTGNYQVIASLTYQNSQKKIKIIKQDNYKHSKHPPFEIYISESDLPTFPDWHWGDLHVHSDYTRDQVEFGAPLEATTEAAKTAGLHFIAFTDHSYDLDDLPDNFLKNDPDLQKWTNFKTEVAEVQLQQDDFLIIPGEEVSVGNNKNRNIHCLILNDPRFYPGKGDSGEKLWRNTPTLSLDELLFQKSRDALAIAAHPQEKPPLSQQIILRRGIWNNSDAMNGNLNALQIVNRHENMAFREGLKLWKERLLQGQKIGIVAGTDSHGNFNCFRQISIPFLRMVYSRKHIMGKARTAVMLEDFSLAALMDGIRNLHTVISNGPIAIFEVHGKEIIPVGGTISATQEMQLVLKGNSTVEFGFWKEMNLYYGHRAKETEVKFEIDTGENNLEFQSKIKVHEPDADYIRLEAYSTKGDQPYYCLTNPIWIEANK
jgi:hypothetical protein